MTTTGKQAIASPKPTDPKSGVHSDASAQSMRKTTMADICGKYSCLGSECGEPKGHSGPHRRTYPDGRSTQWTDESDRRAADYIANQVNRKGY